ncbi:putative D-cysteine desulfhydrase 1, mitochondrial isoform X1 [Zingiber officinale]|uniref:putative D-cysteine desulfhydrase 1, mitochondrial isoform X1 n=1 Tax=Zingiber officinale TaxID=94328 RepID=UPI001C4D2F29|nr:putative D-cysteine desulfhydrase 1, mitochondrial isoform X1 [Zingiber officinale]XP_042405858.1 putative D-cysteine desulfhydrase 1, mitochondrial isoform X1 [Zingiber officinale]
MSSRLSLLPSLRPYATYAAVSSGPADSTVAAARPPVRGSTLIRSSMDGGDARSAVHMGGFLSMRRYDPPSWSSHLRPLPSHTFSLGHLPTPIHRWNLPHLSDGVEVWIKRDDLSGMQLSGNKVRKLEFLMADAIENGADCVITVGGIQSNHCRATAVAARYLNLDCYLILRTSKALVEKDPGLVGNLLVERLVGAHIDLVSKEEYAKIGSVTLADLLKKKLMKEGRNPYVIPVGGSNSLGSWGYIEAINEIEQQIQSNCGVPQFDDIVVACGSGGTIAGLSLGSKLSNLTAKVHAFSVCDDPNYFYNFVQGLIDGLRAGSDARDLVEIQDAKGLGYAMSTAEELKFVKDIAAATGVVLDPVYSGKAAYGMLKDMASNPAKWTNRKVLFIHTGGLLGLYDKVEEMTSLVADWRKMEIDESTPREDGIGKMF